LAEGNDLCRAFATCFCESGDLLSQWRSYGRSGGYALGFSAERLTATSLGEDATETQLVLSKVAYGEIEAARHLEALQKELASQSPWGLHGARSHMFVLQRVMAELARVKDPSWHEEQEWRLIIPAYRPAHLRPRFRVSDVAIVPYIELPIPDGAIKEVVIGPGQYSGARRESVQAMVNAFGADEEISVRQSHSTLRV
jgi:hypothetical protein